MNKISRKLDLLDEKLTETLLATKDFLDLEEASKYLKLSKSTLYKLTSKKEIPFYRPGGKKIFFKREDLNQWICTDTVKQVIETTEILSKHIKV